MAVQRWQARFEYGEVPSIRNTYLQATVLVTHDRVVMLSDVLLLFLKEREYTYVERLP